MFLLRRQNSLSLNSNINCNYKSQKYVNGTRIASEINGIFQDSFPTFDWLILQDAEAVDESYNVQVFFCKLQKPLLSGNFLFRLYNLCRYVIYTGKYSILLQYKSQEIQQSPRESKEIQENLGKSWKILTNSRKSYQILENTWKSQKILGNPTKS